MAHRWSDDFRRVTQAFEYAQPGREEAAAALELAAFAAVCAIEGRLAEEAWVRGNLLGRFHKARGELAEAREEALRAAECAHLLVDRPRGVDPWHFEALASTIKQTTPREARLDADLYEVLAGLADRWGDAAEGEARRFAERREGAQDWGRAGAAWIALAKAQERAGLPADEAARRGALALQKTRR